MGKKSTKTKADENNPQFNVGISIANLQSMDQAKNFASNLLNDISSNIVHQPFDKEEPMNASLIESVACMVWGHHLIMEKGMQTNCFIENNTEFTDIEACSVYVKNMALLNELNNYAMAYLTKLTKYVLIHLENRNFIFSNHDKKGGK